MTDPMFIWFNWLLAGFLSAIATFVRNPQSHIDLSFPIRKDLQWWTFMTGFAHTAFGPVGLVIALAYYITPTED